MKKNMPIFAATKRAEEDNAIVLLRRAEELLRRAEESMWDGTQGHAGGPEAEKTAARVAALAAAVAVGRRLVWDDPETAAHVVRGVLLLGGTLLTGEEREILERASALLEDALWKIYFP